MKEELKNRKLLEKSRTAFINTLVFPVWIKIYGKWHVYKDTDIYFNNGLETVHKMYCGKSIIADENTPKSLLGYKFIKMTDVCPVCKEYQINELKRLELLKE